MKKELVFSQELGLFGFPQAEGMVLSQCIRAGHVVYLSGQTGVSLEGRLVGLGSVAAQTRQACENIKALVQMAGGVLTDVMKLVVYVTDRAHRPFVYEGLRRYFPDVMPCLTLYVVPDLTRKELLIEIDAWVFIDGDDTKKKLLRTRDITGLDESGGGRRAAQGYWAANLVYLEGQTGRTLDGERVGHGGPAAEARQAMENIRTLMEMAGGTIADVVRLGKTVTKREDRATTYPIVRSYWVDVPPPGTGLIVNGLATDESRIAVDAWGFVDTKDAQKRVVRRHDVTAAAMLGATGSATQCVRAGNLVFMQGQVAWTLESQLVAIGDPPGQARQAMENIKALMELAGGSLSDIVRIVVYVTDPTVCCAAYPILGEFWNGRWPCTSAVVVKGLARPELLLEIDAYGFIDDPD